MLSFYSTGTGTRGFRVEAGGEGDVKGVVYLSPSPVSLSPSGVVTTGGFFRRATTAEDFFRLPGRGVVMS